MKLKCRRKFDDDGILFINIGVHKSRCTKSASLDLAPIPPSKLINFDQFKINNRIYHNIKYDSLNNIKLINL